MSTHDLPKDIRIEPGARRDYERLRHLHYRPGRPGPITNVDRAVCSVRTVVGRFLQRREETRVVGVIVRSRPPLACVLRDVATHGRYRDLPARERAALINREVRTISRVIVHPQWRGAGLAVGLVRHVLATAETPYTEARAAMGRIHPFFERAGMTAYRRPRDPADARLIEAVEHLGLDARLLVMPSRLAGRTAALSVQERSVFERELRRWHRTGHRNRSRERREADMPAMLEVVREQVFVRPVYYLARRFDARADDPPPPADPSGAEAIPHAVTFFLQREERLRLLRRLRRLHTDRARALVALLDLDS